MTTKVEEAGFDLVHPQFRAALQEQRNKNADLAAAGAAIASADPIVAIKTECSTE